MLIRIYLYYDEIVFLIPQIIILYFVNFESKDIRSIEEEFKNAVDDYLDFCKEVGKEPEKQYKGTFNVRVTPELHKMLANFAIRSGQSLNAIVEKAIAAYVEYDGFASKTKC